MNVKQELKSYLKYLKYSHKSPVLCSMVTPMMTFSNPILNRAVEPVGATRGVFGGGYTGSMSNVMDYITIDTTGNATDFGDLTVARWGCAGVSSNTRGVFGGGSTAD